VLFWNLLISLRATVPGRNLWGFLTPPDGDAVFLACLCAMTFLGAYPPVFFLAVCLVLAILMLMLFETYDYMLLK
jgi:histone H3